jgi:hypothetical protein
MARWLVVYYGKNVLRLNDVQPYKTAFNLSNYVWEIVINKDAYQHIFNELQKLPKEINQLIKITNNKLAK